MVDEMVRPARLERATCGFEARRSIQLSYGRTCYKNHFMKKVVKAPARCAGRAQKKGPLFCERSLSRVIFRGLPAIPIATTTTTAVGALLLRPSLIHHQRPST